MMELDIHVNDTPTPRWRKVREKRLDQEEWCPDVHIHVARQPKKLNKWLTDPCSEETHYSNKFASVSKTDVKGGSAAALLTSMSM